MQQLITEKGNLRIVLQGRADKTWVRNALQERGGNDRAFLDDLLEHTGWLGNAVLTQLAAEQVAALTDAPILTNEVRYDDNGNVTHIGDVFWYPGYEVHHFGEVLLANGFVTFLRAAPVVEAGPA
jgi:hypothetical protein